VDASAKKAAAFVIVAGLLLAAPEILALLAEIIPLAAVAA
jgi:hypothetical protein